MDNAENNAAGVPAEQETPVLKQVIGRTTYEVALHFSQTSRETMADKVRRLILNDMGQM